jgi:Ca2+-binding EF-hand superfamily protein
MSEKQLKAAFNALDLDGSGEISLREFEEIFCSGANITKSELQASLAEWDLNKNGNINFEEFKIMVRKTLFKFNRTT